MRRYSIIELISLLFLISLTYGACTDTNCKTCTDPATCDLCKMSYFLENNTCVSCATRIPQCSECTLDNTTSLICNQCLDKYIINNTDNSCLACTKANQDCIKCTIDNDQVVCSGCTTGTVLNDKNCISCQQAFPNCSVCNDTFIPISCVACLSPYYTNEDASKCDTCSNLIPNCAQCTFQAPYEKLQCTTCAQGKQLSDDKYNCNDPSYLGLIVGIVIGALVVIGAVVFGVYWYKKKKQAQKTSFQDEVESYQKV